MLPAWFVLFVSPLSALCSPIHLPSSSISPLWYPTYQTAPHVPLSCGFSFNDAMMRLLSCPWATESTQGGPRNKKKHQGSVFFKLAFRSGLTKYVIRGITIYRSGITIYRLITSDTIYKRHKLMKKWPGAPNMRQEHTPNIIEWNIDVFIEFLSPLGLLC